MSPQGIMSSKKDNNSPGLRPIKGQKPSLGTQTGPTISSQACRVSRSRHRTQCWLTNQRLILFRIYCLETPMAGSGLRNSRTEPPLASSLAISLPHTPACPGTQYSPTACPVNIGKRIEHSF